MGYVESVYKELGIALPGLTESIILFGRWQRGYLIIFFGILWIFKGKWINHKMTKEIDVIGLVAGIFFILLIAYGLIIPIFRTYGPISASE